jgi:sortase A
MSERGKVYRGQRRHSRRAGGAEIARRIARGTGEALITFGLIVLLFAFYEVYGKAAAVDAHQKDLNTELTQTWTHPGGQPVGASGPKLPPPGGALGRLYIPVLHMHWVVVEGVGLDDIQYAPGHYPGTALPGQIGNFSVAGHRIPSIFWDLQKLTPGQIIVVETRDDWYVYQVTQNEVVTPHSVEVVAATPDHIGVAPTEAMMTLTTCNPKWNDYQRMAVHAVLIKTQATSAGPPVALGS